MVIGQVLCDLFFSDRLSFRADFSHWKNFIHIRCIVNQDGSLCTFQLI